MRYFNSAVCHSLATITPHSSHSRFFESRNSAGFVSGKFGVSASVNRGDQAEAPGFNRAASTFTSSAVRSPEPLYQHTNSSPEGSSTIDDEWLCQCSSGKTNSAL